MRLPGELATIGTDLENGRALARVPTLLRPQNQIQETAFSVQIVPGMRFLVFEFAPAMGCRALRYSLCHVLRDATRCLVLTWRMLLQALNLGTWYAPTLACYAKAGTDMAYGAMRVLREAWY
eukprot:1956212-Rhodomonas_salina.5